MKSRQSSPDDVPNYQKDTLSSFHKRKDSAQSPDRLQFNRNKSGSNERSSARRKDNDDVMVNSNRLMFRKSSHDENLNVPIQSKYKTYNFHKPTLSNESHEQSTSRFPQRKSRSREPRFNPFGTVSEKGGQINIQLKPQSAVLQGQYDQFDAQQKRLQQKQAAENHPILLLDKRISTIDEKVGEAQDIFSRKFNLI